MGPPFEAVFLGDNGQGDVQVPSNLGKLVVLVLWIRKCRLPATWPCLAHPLWQPSFIKSRRERLGARDRFDKGPEGSRWAGVFWGPEAVDHPRIRYFHGYLEASKIALQIRLISPSGHCRVGRDAWRALIW